MLLALASCQGDDAMGWMDRPPRTIILTESTFLCQRENAKETMQTPSTIRCFTSKTLPSCAWAPFLRMTTERFSKRRSASRDAVLIGLRGVLLRRASSDGRFRAWGVGAKQMRTGQRSTQSDPCSLAG